VTITVLSLSGGKDSTAAALWLREQGIPHVRLFMDTGWEHAFECECPPLEEWSTDPYSPPSEGIAGPAQYLAR